MKIGVIGATGKAGSLITKEAVNRGHEVTAIVRNASKVDNKDVKVLEKDVFDLVSSDLEGFDVIVNAFNSAPGEETLHVEAGDKLIGLLKNASNTRLIVVGGAGSLFVDENKTVRLVDTPDFPEAYLPTASNMLKNLLELEKTQGLNWTYISPSAFFDPQGERTGNYVSGKDHLLVNAKGDSYISFADYAIAVIDEIEQPEHIKERFTVGSKG
jgi:putative NADH-flavin reductase